MGRELRLLLQPWLFPHMGASCSFLAPVTMKLPHILFELSHFHLSLKASSSLTQGLGGWKPETWVLGPTLL